MTSVLLVRLSAMGDLVQGLGVVQALHRARPQWRVTMVTQAPFAPLLANFPGLARVVAFDRRGGWREVLRLRRELRRETHDVAVDLQGNWKSAAVAWASGARERIGAGAKWRQEPRSAWLLHRAFDIPGTRHPALVAFTLVRHLVPDLAFELPRLVPTADELEGERDAVRRVGLDPDRPFRVIVVTDPADPRALRPRIVSSQAAIGPALLLLGPAESSLATPPGAAVLRHGPDEIRRLVALGAVVAAAKGLVLGPDQGASHVLAASGARCLVMFGAQDPRCTAPPGATALVHATPPACSPCRRRRCHHADGPVCMEFDPAEGVVAPIRWAATNSPGP